MNSLAAVPPSPGDVTSGAACADSEEGLASIAIHSFQLANQIFTVQDFEQ